MASPFATFPNARLAWQRPTSALSSLRNGTRPATTQTVIIEAFVEPAATGPAGVAHQQSGRTGTLQAGQSRGLAGYITRWALLPSGADWLDAGSGWTWNDTGLRPDGLTASRDELQAALVKIEALPATTRGEIGMLTIDQVGSPYGPGGIGEIVTDAIGDYIAGTFRVP